MQTGSKTCWRMPYSRRPDRTNEPDETAPPRRVDVADSARARHSLQLNDENLAFHPVLMCGWRYDRRKVISSSANASGASSAM